jgi:2',3'-cyclic-nucleotide 2'-phosphodiesterase
MGLTFRLMFIGDVVGEAGRAAVSTLVPVLRRELDAVVANGENSASTRRGITPESALELLSVVDFLTLGNHAFDVEGSERFLE